MANTSVSNALKIGKCHCETGRKRHRIPQSLTIPFESPGPLPDSQTLPDPQPPDEEPGFFLNLDNWDSPDGSEEEEGDDSLSLDEFLTAVDEDEDGGQSTSDGGQSTSEPSVQPELTPHDEAETGAREEDIPKIAMWRLNLTALSQVYNFYMVAYGNLIHISRPRSCVNNNLPSKPDLVLEPPTSDWGQYVSGQLDMANGHMINHLMVGDLGEEEILLMAYDDGDVAAYYTSHIERYLASRERETSASTPKLPEPFFLQNCRISAWGLAIHKKSRMIAVGTNNHDVNVFVFAITGQPYRHVPGTSATMTFRRFLKDYHGNVRTDRLGVARNMHWEFQNDLEELVRRRDANWQITLRAGPGANNIPNVAFISDADGEAERIIAVDIRGKLWFMDIYDLSSGCPEGIPALHISRKQFMTPQHTVHAPMGWGVLVLPGSSFLPTKSYCDSLGLPPTEAVYFNTRALSQATDAAFWISTGKSISHIKDNSSDHPWMRSEWAQNAGLQPVLPRRKWFDTSSSSLDWLHEADVREDRLQRSRLDWESYLSVSKQSKRRPSRQFKLPDGSSIMRTYEADIELRSHTKGGVSIVCEHVISQDRALNLPLNQGQMGFQRLSNLHHVPELSLVVAGSSDGRVALVTLTQPRYELSFQRGFKVEAILPTRRDEDRGLRPVCALLGVAIGPMPVSGRAEKAELLLGARRYRVMLHYYDLRILSYEIYRDGSDELMIIGT
ncbi:hypothetical protein F5Y15DRAFT_358853 [Xylariaceae sp. FL0016]|nr:hypothetical protein F5Y15DRAFT_358853 [Xylariaceae sp. FL0016]